MRNNSLLSFFGFNYQFARKLSLEVKLCYEGEMRPLREKKRKFNIKKAYQMPYLSRGAITDQSLYAKVHEKPGNLE